MFEDYATLDLVSGGRAEIIAGRGSTRESFPLFGWSLDDYDALFEEKLGLPLAYGVLVGRVDGAVPVGEAYAEAAAQAGHDPRTLRKTIAGHGFVAWTSQEAHDTLYKYFAYGMHQFARSQGNAGPPISRAAFAGQTSPHRALISGSPQQVIDKLMLQHHLYGKRQGDDLHGSRRRAARQAPARDRTARLRGRPGAPQGAGRPCLTRPPRSRTRSALTR